MGCRVGVNDGFNVGKSDGPVTINVGTLLKVGFDEGIILETIEGDTLGSKVGIIEGLMIGFFDGFTEGSLLGIINDTKVGDIEGFFDGFNDGGFDGFLVAFEVGDFVGIVLGSLEGLLVGSKLVGIVDGFVLKRYEGTLVVGIIVSG
jgi:hypothetical protein